MSKSIVGTWIVMGLVSACLTTVGTSGGGSVAGDAGPSATTLPDLDSGGVTSDSGTGTVAANADAGSTVSGVATALRAECESYLECVNQSNPRAGGAAVALYGADSPCWRGSVADAKRCADACQVERTSTSPAGTTYPACGCSRDAQCASGFCATGLGRCGDTTASVIYAECKKALPKIDAIVTNIVKSPNNAFCVAVVDADCEGLRKFDASNAPSAGPCYAQFAAGTKSQFSQSRKGLSDDIFPASCKSARTVTYACIDESFGLKVYAP
jgi:hypothetical protein